MKVIEKCGLTIVMLLVLGGYYSCSKDSGAAPDDSTEVPPEENVEIPPKKDHYPGLSVSTDGTLLLNGDPYQGVGVNYFSAFTRTLEEGQQNDISYRTGFAYLKERKIPFVRFSVNGFWPKNWGLYRDHPDAFFKSLDAFVAAAEEFGIGLIPSFFWHTPTVPDLVGEPVNQWGNQNSKTHELMRKFIRDVVVRYRDSPAIWGWEQGNEVNLLVDLPGENDNLPPIVPSLGTPSTRSKQDKLYTADLTVMMEAFAKEVRKYDGTRIVITGNAVSRPAARNLWKNQSWTKDTRAEFMEMLAVQNPDPMDMLCTHIYPAIANEGYFGNEQVGVEKVIQASMEAAAAQHKPLFIGEWGAQEAVYGTQTPDKFRELLRAIEDHHVPLSAMWVFDYPPQDTEEGINVAPNNGPREYMLQEIMKVNERIMSVKN